MIEKRKERKYQNPKKQKELRKRIIELKKKGLIK